MGAARNGPVSRATAERLSHYLRCLGPAARHGGTVSSPDLARAVSVSAAQVRRDLAALGHLGRRGVGYDAPALAAAIRHALGLDRRWDAVLVGVGNLARALLKSQTFRGQGFQVIALFDSDPAKLGQVVEGLPVEPLSAIAPRVAQTEAELAVLTVPAGPAQSVADLLIAAGIKGVMNFAPVALRVPPHVHVVAVDLAIQLEQLAFQVQFASPAPPLADAESRQNGVDRGAAGG